jgi:hypothetical protein
MREPTAILVAETRKLESGRNAAVSALRALILVCEWVNKDRTTVDIAVHNMALVGLAWVVECRLVGGHATLASAVSSDRGFSIVHLDSPWRGEYQYDLTRPFMLEALAINVQQLVGLGLDCARLVVLNLPHNALSPQIGDLAAPAGCNALVQYQYVADFPASFGQARRRARHT